jgi:hypothetical protein
MELDVVAPRYAQSYPAILYLTGLSGLLPSMFQASLIDSIAEQGYVYITVFQANNSRSQNCKVPFPKK